MPEYLPAIPAGTPVPGKLLQFEPFLTNIDATFWHRLAERKLDDLKLSHASIPVYAQYPAGRRLCIAKEALKASNASETAVLANDLLFRALPATMRLSAAALASEPLPLTDINDHSNNDNRDAIPSGGTLASVAGTGGGPLVAPIQGLLTNTNTIEEFIKLNRTASLATAAQALWYAIRVSCRNGTGITPAELNTLLVLSFADLKKYKFYYYCAYPVIPMPIPARVLHAKLMMDAWQPSEIQSLRTLHREFYDQHSNLATVGIHTMFVVVKPQTASDATPMSIHPLAQYPALLAQFDPNPDYSLVVGVLDSSGLLENPGWPLRNLLLWLQFYHSFHRLDTPSEPSASLPAFPTSVKLALLAYRSGTTASSHPRASSMYDPSLVLTVAIPLIDDLSSYDVDSSWPPALPSPVGWEKHPEGKRGPRIVNLAATMDPTQLATTAMHLNLKLMKWRVAPALDLDAIQSKRYLLLGAGTLGSYVARTLLAWGACHLTLVDNGRVSYSNPVRQPLYTFADSTNGGQWKALAAAQNLQSVYPLADTAGHCLTIPMPGHPVSLAQKPAVEAELRQLESLIKSHDVIFLLTDSRESRWLPTLWGAFHRKLVINAALGFDGYLVMRHGVPQALATTATTLPSEHGATRLGCYFCNDVVAPTDSLSDRTLDQQCTVTRPGLAPVAGALAVELLVTILQHPEGTWASPPVNLPAANSVASAAWMGQPPHQIRGFFTGFQQQLITGEAYDKCTACSTKVLDLYATEGYDFLWKVFNNHVLEGMADATPYSYLEAVTGLRDLQLQTDALLADLDWDSDAGSDDDLTEVDG
ncbi:Autophagy protein 7 [Dimargaris xerosporica]|nr:Autophagy protein 7 [Dimargaris xerosporica]